MNIYVGNLDREVTEEELRKIFSVFGQVLSVTIVKDKETGEPRGFAFVQMPASPEAQTAVNALNGKDLKGKTLNVNEAWSRPEDHPPREKSEGRPGREKNLSRRESESRKTLPRHS